MSRINEEPIHQVVEQLTGILGGMGGKVGVLGGDRDTALKVKWR
jgi:hypothetical protein